MKEVYKKLSELGETFAFGDTEDNFVVLGVNLHNERKLVQKNWQKIGYSERSYRIATKEGSVRVTLTHEHSIENVLQSEGSPSRQYARKVLDSGTIDDEVIDPFSVKKRAENGKFSMIFEDITENEAEKMFEQYLEQKKKEKSKRFLTLEEKEKLYERFQNECEKGVFIEGTPSIFLLNENGNFRLWSASGKELMSTLVFIDKHQCELDEKGIAFIEQLKGKRFPLTRDEMMNVLEEVLLSKECDQFFALLDEYDLLQVYFPELHALKEKNPKAYALTMKRLRESNERDVQKKILILLHLVGREEMTRALSRLELVSLSHFSIQYLQMLYGIESFDAERIVKKLEQDELNHHAANALKNEKTHESTKEDSWEEFEIEDTPPIIEKDNGHDLF